MGDDLVKDVVDSLADLAFANGMNVESIRPYVDAIINSLRASGMSDDDIRAALFIDALVSQAGRGGKES